MVELCQTLHTRGSHLSCCLGEEYDSQFLRWTGLLDFLLGNLWYPADTPLQHLEHLQI